VGSDKAACESAPGLRRDAIGLRDLAREDEGCGLVM
jgi:hypothetical protein